MTNLLQFFKNNWRRYKRYYTLKHNRAYRGKGQLEKAQAVEANAKHAIFMFILLMLVGVIVLLVVEALAHGVGVMTELQDWFHALMKMKIPATDPRKN